MTTAFPNLVAAGLIQFQPPKPKGRPRIFTDAERIQRNREACRRYNLKRCRRKSPTLSVAS